MKTLLFLLVFVFNVSVSSAATLKCWDVYSPRGAKPTIVARVLSDQELADFEVNTVEENFTSYLKAPVGTVTGALIESNRSPYKGNQEFDLAGSRLILPIRLDRDSLLEAQKTGIGMGAGENGVIIGDVGDDGDGGGSHFSVRLRCRSYDR